MHFTAPRARPGSSRLRRLTQVLAAAGGLWLAATPAEAALKALLVGVSDYPTLDKRYQLEGPRNDVRRMRAVLLQRGFAAGDIQVVADGVDGGSLPTRENIMAALARLETTAAPGDTVMLYFAGHGSQQPANRNTPEGRDEPDGMHEIFLPRDVGTWSGGQGSVANAIADHELRRSVDRILARGAFVWGVFDACHSATMVRSAADASEIRYRHVSPQALGLGTAQLDAAAADAASGLKTRGGAADAPGAGGPAEVSMAAPAAGGASAFFYAAQTFELAPEMRLPLGDPNRQSHGLFGFMLMRALESGAPMTYRQLSQYVLNEYGALNEARVTPLFSGSALDSPVLGQASPPVRQWPLGRATGSLTLPAGTLSDLNPGTVLAVVPGPLAGADAAIGHVRVDSADGATASVSPVAYAGQPAPAAAELPAGAYARVVQRAVSYVLRVSVDATDCARACPAAAALERLRARPDGLPGLRVEWVAGKAPADVRLQLAKDQVRVLPPSQQAQVECPAKPPAGSRCEQPASLGIALQPGLPDSVIDTRLAQALHSIGRATNLLRIASAQAGTVAGNALEVKLELLRGGQRLPLTPDQVPLLKAGDKLVAALRNTGRVPLDVTLLYVDANYGIGVLFPAGLGASNRLEPLASTSTDEIEITDTTLGVERILTIAAQAQTQAERTDFSFLAQAPLEAARDLRTRGGAESDDLQAFRDAGFAAFTTRGAAVGKAPSGRTSMQVFTLRVGR